MIYLDSLEEKINDIADTDITIIEDGEDTKKIQIGTLKNYLQEDTDDKIALIKTATIEQCIALINTQKQDILNVTNAYYALARNYEYLNSAFDEMKETLATLVHDQEE